MDLCRSWLSWHHRPARRSRGSWAWRPRAKVCVRVDLVATGTLRIIERTRVERFGLEVVGGIFTGATLTNNCQCGAFQSVLDPPVERV